MREGGIWAGLVDSPRRDSCRHLFCGAQMPTNAKMDLSKASALLVPFKDEAMQILIAQGPRLGCGPPTDLSIALDVARYLEVVTAINTTVEPTRGATVDRLFKACSISLLAWMYSVMFDKSLAPFGCSSPSTRGASSRMLQKLPSKASLSKALRACQVPFLDVRLVSQVAHLWAEDLVVTTAQLEAWKSARISQGANAPRIYAAVPEVTGPASGGTPVPGHPPSAPTQLPSSPGSATDTLAAARLALASAQAAFDAEAARAAAAAAPGTGPLSGGIQPDLVALLKILVENQATLIRNGTAAPPAPPKATVTLDGKQRLLAAAKLRLAEGYFVDPSSLSTSALERAILKPASSTVRAALQNCLGTGVDDMESSLTSSSDASWPSLLSGLSRMQDLWETLDTQFSHCSKMVRNLLLAVEEASPLNSDTDRATYVRKLLIKYPDPRTSDWSELVSSDVALLSAYLMSPLAARSTKRPADTALKGAPTRKDLKRAAGQRNSGKGGGGKGQQGAVKGGRGGNRGKGGGGKGAGPHPRYPGVCFTRSSVKAGACGRGATCKFSHLCVTCNVDHDAATCLASGTWDASLDSDP